MLGKPSHRGHRHLAVCTHTYVYTNTQHTLSTQLVTWRHVQKSTGKRKSQKSLRETSKLTGLFSTYWVAQECKAISLLQNMKLFYSLWVEINDKLSLFFQSSFKAHYKNKSPCSLTFLKTVWIIIFLMWLKNKK